ncbi:hypothetical protein MTO96_019751 [Rhipicephalus appendiculatus]
MEKINYGQVIRDVVAAGLSKVPRSLARKLLAADVRLKCSTALLRTITALQNFEPWALRLVDATGKYPSGLLEDSRVDMGAFDECIETAVRDRNGNVLSRGQYCNLLVHVDNATAMKAMINYMMCVPLFFVIMWFYLLPRFVDGPDTETFFQRFYADMSKHWWTFLVQIRNFCVSDRQAKALGFGCIRHAFTARLHHCNMDHGQIESTTISRHACP